MRGGQRQPLETRDGDLTFLQALVMEDGPTPSRHYDVTRRRPSKPRDVCPFCGLTIRYVHWPVSGGGELWESAHEDRARALARGCPLVTQGYPTREDARACFNTRYVRIFGKVFRIA